MPEANTYAKGVMGEAAACEYLCNKGMELLARRLHSAYGEIDLVMLDGDVLVFVEVKARERSNVESALLAVTPQKQQRIIQTARCFLSENPQHNHRVMRFDVVAVTRMGVTHVPDAFRGTEW